MNIVRLHQDEKLLPLYADYVGHRTEAMLYYSLKYKDFLKALLGSEEEYLVAMNCGKIVGVFPLMYMERAGVRVYNSLPFYGSHGGVIADDDEVRDRLCAEYMEIAKSQNTMSSTIIGNPFTPRCTSNIPWTFQDYRVGQVTSLEFEDCTEDYFYSCVETRARGSIRKAKKEGVVVDKDPSELGTLAAMHLANMNAIKGPAKSHKFFELVPEYFREEVEYNVYIARKNKVIVSALLVFYYNDIVEYYVPATHAKYRTLQPMSLILMTAMLEAAERGCRYWNWGSSGVSQENVYRFKRQWGAIDYKYHYYTYLNHKHALELSSEEILESYPHYYVVPFSMLASQQGRVQ